MRPASKQLEVSLTDEQFYHALHDRDKGWSTLTVEGKLAYRLICPKCRARISFQPSRVTSVGFIRGLLYCTNEIRNKYCGWAGLVRLVDWTPVIPTGEPNVSERESSVERPTGSGGGVESSELPK